MTALVLAFAAGWAARGLLNVVERWNGTLVRPGSEAPPREVS